MGYKSFIGSKPGLAAGVGWLPSSYRKSSSYTGLSDSGGLILVSGVQDTDLFSIGDLVNIRPDNGDPSTDSTVSAIGSGTVTLSAPFVSDSGAGVLSQRFHPPKKGS